MVIREGPANYTDEQLEQDLLRLIRRKNDGPIRNYEIQAFVAKCLNEGFARGYGHAAKERNARGG